MGGKSGVLRSQEAVSPSGTQHPFPTYAERGGVHSSVADPLESHLIYWRRAVSRSLRISSPPVLGHHLPGVWRLELRAPAGAARAPRQPLSAHPPRAALCRGCGSTLPLPRLPSAGAAVPSSSVSLLTSWELERLRSLQTTCPGLGVWELCSGGRRGHPPPQAAAPLEAKRDGG